MNFGPVPLRPGDPAPDFELPAADRDGVVRLADYRGQGPVLLAVLRGLYCPFCRRHLTQLGELAEPLRDAGLAVLGIVVATADRARLYFRFRSARFPIAVDPDRATHRAYGLPEVARTPRLAQVVERAAQEFARELNIQVAPERLSDAVKGFDGFVPLPSDVTESQAPLQMSGHFLVDREGIVRWTSVEHNVAELPSPEELLKLSELCERGGPVAGRLE